MNRFLATTAIALLMGAAPALAQSPGTPSSPPQEPSAQAPMQPSEASPPSALPSEAAGEPSMKAPDQASEAPKSILPEQSAQEQSAPEPSAQGSAQFLNEQKSDDILASTLIGQPAVNSQDEGIGEVNDLVTDRSGKILAALIGVGGFLGIGEKDVAVRFEDLKLSRDENNSVKVVLNISKETLASAPDYKLLGEQPVVEGSIKSDSGDPSRAY